MIVMGSTGAMPSVDWVGVESGFVEFGADVDVVAFASSVIVTLVKYQTRWMIGAVLLQAKLIAEGSWIAAG